MISLKALFASEETTPALPSRETAVPSRPAPARTKLSYRDQRELTDLPAKIHALEEEQLQLQAKIASPEFYKEAAHVITQTLARADEVQDALLTAMERWDELDSRT